MRRDVRSFIVGALFLPLSALPFGVYATQTPEGRLLADRATAAIAPPTLPELSAAERSRLRAGAPDFDDGVAVLVYHGIGSGTSAEGGYSLSPERFAEQLAALRVAGLNPVTMQEVAEAREGRRTLPANAVALTFDDGRTDAMLFADQLMEQAGWRATMYVITGRAEGRTSPYYVGWDDLVDYHDSGRWDLQSHTDDLHRHTADGLPALTALDEGEDLADYRRRIRRDLDRARSSIQAHTGVAPATFAYPFGAHGAERTNEPAIADVLAEEVGRLHTLAVHQDGQDDPRLATHCDRRLQLRRLEVGDWSGLELLGRITEASRRTTPCSSGRAGMVALAH
jgi:poly-beta-1,6-N-acetyl-D-glucosamine N-deacetylase